MGYQPRAKTPRRTVHVYRKTLREAKSRKHSAKRLQEPEEKAVVSERQISELTFRRLHTLGSQRFGSFPFSEHFDRWFINVTAVLAEFESHPSIGVDDQFVAECTHALDTAKRQLEARRQKEILQEQEVRDLANYKNLLKQIDDRYVAQSRELRVQRRLDTKPLYSEISRLKQELDVVIRMKTGLFRGVSRKAREKKEAAVSSELNGKQTELEMAILTNSARQKQLREAYEQEREPVEEQIKRFRKTMRSLETDGSLEERWFACEALVDAVNGFLQRKAANQQT